MNTTIGRRSSRRAFSTSKPSMPGICTSRNISSGLLSRTAITASGPLACWPTTSISRSLCSISRTRRRASRSSSTISARIAPPSSTGSTRGLITRGVHGMEWHFQRDDRSAFPSIAQLQNVVLAVQPRQPRSRIRQTDPFPVPIPVFTVRRETRPIVSNLYTQSAAVPFARNPNAPRLDFYGDSVPDGILHNGLQDQVGYMRRQSGRRDFEIHRKPVLETGQLDVQVAAQELQLLLQSDLLVIGIVERKPQEISQPRHHPVGRFHVRMQQRRNRVQRVEQKVRMQLHFEGAELGLRKLRLELGRLQFLRAQTRLILNRMAGDQYQPIQRNAQLYIPKQ